MKIVATFSLALFAALAAAGDTTLTTVAEANNIDLEELKTPRAFAFTGTVMVVDKNWLMISDDTGGAQIYNLNSAPPPADIRQWDVVDIRGKMLFIDKEKTRRLISRKTKVLKHGSPIPPIDATVQDVASGRLDFRRVRMRGVLSSFVKDEVAPDFIWCWLRTANGNFMVVVKPNTLRGAAISDLIDADVEIVGLAMPVIGLRQSLGRYIRLFSPDDSIRILKPPPDDPFATPPLLESRPSQHRQRIAGDVIAVSRSCFFLRTGIGRIVKVTPLDGNTMPQIGDKAIVAGFPEYVPYWLCLSDAVFKVSGKSDVPGEKPLHMTIAGLFTDSKSRKCFNVLKTGHRLAVQGKVVAATDDELELSDGKNSLFVMLDSLRTERWETPRIGSTVEATGLCWSEFHNRYESDMYPTFLRFALYPRDADDIRVIASPPWWTPLRLMAVIEILLVVLTGSGIWNLALKKKSERRGRELYEEKIGHALAEQKVEERTRLAVELHDSISQTLTGIALHLDSGETETARTMLAACRSELRHCLWDLRSRTFEEKDMTEAVERTIAPHLCGMKAAVRFNVPRERLSESLTHAVLKIIRELVVNALRHGQAKRVWIAGEMHGGQLSFSVQDDGCGFDPDNAPSPEQGHFGLLGVRERIEEFDGEMTLDAAPGRGAKISVSMKLKE